MADPSGKTPTITTSTQQFIIGLLVVVLVGFLIGAMFFVTVPKDNARLLDISLGVVLGAMGTVLAFYFPSSVGSRAKDEAISSLATQIAGSPPTTSTTTTVVKKDPPDITKESD